MLIAELNQAECFGSWNESFRKAYAFLKNTDLPALPLGRAAIDGEMVYANVQEYTTMAPEVCRFEAHDKYFDIQYVVSGCERFYFAKRRELAAETEYEEAEDLLFFQEPEACGAVILMAGDVAVDGPGEAHKPRCVAGQPCWVRKIVVKVRA